MRVIRCMMHISHQEYRDILEISNTVKQQNTGVESNHIGLMSVEKMMHQLGGESTFSEKNGSFSVELKFSLVH